VIHFENGLHRVSPLILEVDVRRAGGYLKALLVDDGSLISVTSVPADRVHRRCGMTLASPRTTVVNPPPEVRPALVSGSVFKTDGAPRKRALGGFDSRALPLC